MRILGGQTQALFSDRFQLEDTTPSIRAAMYQLLGEIPLCNIQGTQHTIQSLARALVKHPQDRSLIYATLAGIGKNHGHFMEYLVEDLLNIHGHFLPVEPNVDDAVYAGVLAALCNGAVSNPNILALLPHYSGRHYALLKERYPSCYPQNLIFSSRGTHLVTQRAIDEEARRKAEAIQPPPADQIKDMDAIVASLADRLASSQDGRLPVLEELLNELGCKWRGEGIVTSKSVYHQLNSICIAVVLQVRNACVQSWIGRGAKEERGAHREW